MNFCQNCGTDLRSQQNFTFCFNCGAELALENLNNSTIFEKTHYEKKDDFDYFDFPQSESNLRHFISHIDEHIALNPPLTHDKVGDKYLKKGKEYFDANDLDDFNIDGLTGKWKYPRVSEKDAYFATACYHIANEFCDDSESLYQLWGCYYFKGDHKKAQQNIILHAEKTKKKFGIESSESFSAAIKAYDYTKNNENYDLAPLPNWIVILGRENDSQELPI